MLKLFLINWFLNNAKLSIMCCKSLSS